MAIDEGRLAALRATKLRSLVGGLLEDPGTEITGSAPTSSITGCVASGRAYVLVHEVHDLGPALHWYRRQPADGLTVLVEPEAAGDVARRAEPLQADIDVFRIDGPSVRVAEPTPPAPPPELPVQSWQAAAVIADAGITVLDDHGRLIGEVNGLEVARVEGPDPGDAGTKPTLRVGVGEADRQLHNHVHTHLDDVERLTRAAETVRQHRRPDGGHHPLGRLARPRWIRSMLLDRPSLLGLETLEPVTPLRPSIGIRDTEPAAAYSADERVTVVCSAGVDLDLIPEAADYRLRVDPGSRLLLVLPPRDVKLSTWGLVDLLADVQVTAVDPPW